MRWEPLRVSDAADCAEVIADAELADQIGEHYDADDVAEQLADSGLDLAAASVGVWDGDRLAAYGVLGSNGSPAPVHRVFFDGFVRPAYRRRGLGGQLVEWAIEATAAVAAARHPDAPCELHADVSDTNEGKQALFTRAGFAPQRWFFAMRRPLAGDLPEIAVPDGYRIERFDLDRHDEAARLVRNAAFADHWGASEKTPDAWQHWFTGTRTFRPDLSFVARADSPVTGAGDALAAILLTHHYEADTQATGRAEAWIAVIGTRREHRGRGVAGTLLASALRHAQLAGFAQAGLGVDVAGPTGALGLYQSAGFTVEHRYARYVKTFYGLFHNSVEL
ncbi:GNAT family N-acetyltransferase [Catellatospora chokoriensis]|uniref:N-acetyltransferase n=1 Tax=Catellatospora chokoriensis TaxID=310353 RepID=A0A8J3K7G1_9ACTN|nr:GNAT family N-acetyltransferase [Catellatospora chokoriensis]GIF91608.1 N-acetyltransferase [Catellatospora chokoriensis]